MSVQARVLAPEPEPEPPSARSSVQARGRVLASRVEHRPVLAAALRAWTRLVAAQAQP